MRTLEVVINARHVATLRDDAGIWSLEYRDDWLADPQGFDLSPALGRGRKLIVDGSSERPVQWFFSAGEARLLRRIVYGVIRDMTQRLGT